MSVPTARDRLDSLRALWERVNQLAPGVWSEYLRGEVIYSVRTETGMSWRRVLSQAREGWAVSDRVAVAAFVAELHNAALWLISTTADYIESAPNYSEIARNNAKLVEENARLRREIDQLKLGSIKEIQP